MRWYAVMTKARKEELAQKNLKWQGYHTFYPHFCEWTQPKKTKPRCLRKPYLTRYLFVGIPGTNPKHSFYQINNTIGVSTVVYCGYQALSISTTILDHFREKADERGEITIEQPSKGFPGRPGDLIKFKDTSPLFSFIAQIKRVDKGGKLMVELDKLLGSHRQVTVSASDVGEIIYRECDPGTPKGAHSRPLGPTSGKGQLFRKGGSLTLVGGTDGV